MLLMEGPYKNDDIQGELGIYNLNEKIEECRE